MQSTSSFNLKNAKYPVVELGKGIHIDAPTKGGKLVGTKRPDGSYRRQCGEYCNDVIGIPGYFGDTLASKKARITTQEPNPGSIAIIQTRNANGSINKNGHVLAMEVPQGGESWTISESNFDDKENFRRFNTTISELKKRGLIGFTGGLDMSKPLPPVSPEAKEAWAVAKRKGVVDDKSNPQELIGDAMLQWIFHKSGAMQKPKQEKKERQWWILALYNKKFFDELPDVA